MSVLISKTVKNHLKLKVIKAFIAKLVSTQENTLKHKPNKFSIYKPSKRYKSCKYCNCENVMTLKTMILLYIYFMT